jgi:transposase
MPARKPCPSDVSDEEWALVAPYLTLLPEGAGQREHPLRDDQAQCWLRAGCFEMLVQDLRAVLRLAQGRTEEPSAAVLDSRTLRSTPESGGRAAWNGHKCVRGSKLHLAVDTLRHLLALHVTPANTDARSVVSTLAEAVQDAIGET